jgi:serine/threonine protein kinase
MSSEDLEIPSTPVEAYKFIVSVGELGGSQNSGLAILERESDKCLVVRKLVDSQTIIYSGRPPLNRRRLRTIQSLKHPNICEVFEITSSTDNVTFYMELCDMGSLSLHVFGCSDEQWWKRSQEVPDEDSYPTAFAWHVLLQSMQAVCYLTYGYQTLKETIATDGAVQGWDPIVHQDLCQPNVFLKSAGSDQYPSVVLGDFDQCQRMSDFLEAQRDRRDTRHIEQEFKQKQQDDLYKLFDLMGPLLRRVKKADAHPIRKLVDGFKMVLRGPDVADDARKIAKVVVEAYKESGVTYEPFRRDLRRLFEKKINHALANPEAMVEKRRPRNVVLGGGLQQSMWAN